MYCNVVTAIDKIPMYLLRFNRWPRSKSATIIGRMESRYALDLQHPINTHLFCRMPISPNQLLKPSGTLYGSPHPNHHDQHLQCHYRQQPHSATQQPSILSRMACHLSTPRSWGCTPCGPPHLSMVHVLWWIGPISSMSYKHLDYKFGRDRQATCIWQGGFVAELRSLAIWCWQQALCWTQQNWWKGQIACGWVSSQVHLSCIECLTSLMASLRYLLKGMPLYQEDDHQWLTTDPMIYTPSSDGHLLWFLPYWMDIAPTFVTMPIVFISCIYNPISVITCYAMWAMLSKPFFQVGYLFWLKWSRRMCGVWTRKTSITQRMRHACHVLWVWVGWAW